MKVAQSSLRTKPPPPRPLSSSSFPAPPLNHITKEEEKKTRNKGGGGGGGGATKKFEAKKKKLATKEGREEFFESLFTELGLQNMLQLQSLSKRRLYAAKGGKWLVSCFAGDYDALLRATYPHFPWRSTALLPTHQRLQRYRGREYFAVEANKLDYMQRLFQSAQLTSFEDWKSISKTVFITNRGYALLSIHGNHIPTLLSCVYPNYPWNFSPSLSPPSSSSSPSTASSLFEITDRVREEVEMIARKLKLKSMTEWRFVSLRKFIQNGGKRIVQQYCVPLSPFLFSSSSSTTTATTDKGLSSSSPSLSDFDLLSFLSSVYPQLESILHSTSITGRDHHQQHIDDDDDRRGGGANKEKKGKGKEREVRARMMISTAPNRYFRSAENRVEYMEQVYQSLELRSLDDWYRISKSHIKRQYGAHSLLSSYHGNSMYSLLSAVYPNYPWIESLFDRNPLNHLDYQRSLMNDIAARLHIRRLDDWLFVSKNQIIRNGGKPILKLYKYDLRAALQSIYSAHDWSSLPLKYRHSISYLQSPSFLRYKLIELQTKFVIQRKSDWFRLNLRMKEINVFDALQRIHSNEVWCKSDFILRSKKSNQRLLFAELQKALNFHHLIIEDYRHSSLRADHHPLCANHHFFEFDVFIPSLNVAFEYQGEHHYQDMPSGFTNLELYQSRDKLKQSMANSKNIRLLTIPFWWNPLLHRHFIISFLSSHI